MKSYYKLYPLILPALLMLTAGGSCDSQPSSDEIQRAQQEKILQEGTSQVGMPAIKNFRERKMLKDILELRDQDGIVTFTYIWSDMKGSWTFFCNSVGYGIPYATEFTNPQKVIDNSPHYGVVLPQADPNGLFSPASAEGTWVLCKDPHGKDTKPVYLEPRIIVSPFELDEAKSPTEASAIKITPTKK